MLALETDIYSAFDRYCAERFVYALDQAPKLSARASQARDLMRDWDGRLTANSAAARLELRSRRKLSELLLEPKLEAAQQDHRSDLPPLTMKELHWSRESVWLENVLLRQPKRWLPEKYPDFNAAIVAAVEAAANTPDMPPDLKQLSKTPASVLTIQHPILGRIPLINRWSGPGTVPQSGGSFTVKQVGQSFGPSERMTVDFSDFDQTTLNTVTGQGGNFGSPYYMDQWKAWYEGTTFTLPFSDAAVQKTEAHHLLLQPGD
jgi:penicillin amidase